MSRFTALLLSLLLVPPLAACSLCGTPIKKATLGQELDRASVVLLGRITSSRLSDMPVPGAGSSEFQVDAVVKGEASVKKVELDGYIPVLDKPPRYVLFCTLVKGKLAPLLGREVRSEAALDYLRQADAVRAKKDRGAALSFYARYLDHGDDMIAEDAFLEFAKSTDAEVGEAARRLDPKLFRKLLEDPKTPPERMSLFACLLAGSGDTSQADFLKSLLDRPTPRIEEALDGILCGYVLLRPKEGWAKVDQLLWDQKQPFKVRHNVLRTVRFFHNWKPKESRPEVVRALGGLVETDLADMAIDDLRRFEIFELSGKVYKQYARPGLDAPIIRRTIIRYAVAARRRPEERAAAERFLAALPERDRAIAREIEDTER